MEKYKLKYELYFDNNNGDGFTEDDIKSEVEKNEHLGACDACVFVSIIKSEGESFSVKFGSFDGSKKDITQISNIDLFKVWGLLAEKLSEEMEEGFGKELTKETASKIREHVTMEYKYDN